MDGAPTGTIAPPEQLLSRLRESPAMLRGDRAGRPDRQRSLVGAVQWSLSLLSERSRALFHLLDLAPLDDAAARLSPPVRDAARAGGGAIAPDQRVAHACALAIEAAPLSPAGG